MDRLEAIIHGLVQGVGYRYFVLRHARRLGLRGWVRNLADGSVEVLAEGERERLQELLGLLHEGPSGAEVNSVDERWSSTEGVYKIFDITH